MPMRDWLSLVPGTLLSPPLWRWELAQWMESTGQVPPATTGW
jgi:hypothetical protein